MGTVTVSLPTDGDTIDVADYNTPITTLINEFNGNIENTNIKAAAGIDGSKLADGTITLAKLSTGPLSSKIIQFTRDATATGGDVSHTGVGFTPSSIHFLMNIDNTLFRSDGVSDPAKASWSIYQSAANKWYSQVGCIVNSDQGSYAQGAVVKSYDADGFTLTWTKIGTVPAGTMKIIAICYR